MLPITRFYSRRVLYALCVAVALRAPFARAQPGRENPAQTPPKPSTVTVVSKPAAPSNPLAAKARSLYFTSDVLKSAEAFEAAVKTSSKDWTLWVEGALAWAESGRPEKAVSWYRRACALNDQAELRASLGWALLRVGDPAAADAEFTRALGINPDSAWALLGAGRVKLALDKPREAADILQAAARAAPGQSMAPYFLGSAYDKLGDESAAAEAYKLAVGADSYFHEGRGILIRAYLRQRRYNEAWKQLQRLLEGDPGSKLAQALMAKVRPMITNTPEPPAPTQPGPTGPADATELLGGRMPVLRVGVSSTAMGKPRPRLSASFRGNNPWQVLEPKSGRVLFSAGAGESWTLRIVAASKKKKKSRTRLELRSHEGQVVAIASDAILIKPLDMASSLITIEDDPAQVPRAFRGELEFALFGRPRTIRITNIIGLEDYTHGVVSAEMPVRAPLEALKAQAVIARTHAYFIKTMTRRHKKDGYDLCDGQHCQVYGGLHSETPRTRSVVIDTRDRVAFFKGKPAHVIYSSHCGGMTQSGADIGWGNVPYWKGMSDSATPVALPASPLELRMLLSDWPSGYDRPSSQVHPSHARWTRAVSAKELSEKLNRKYKIGQLRGLRVVRRSPAGHVTSLLIIGSKRNKKLTDEMAIRGVAAAGSLRSTYFVFDVEYRKEFPPGRTSAKGKKISAPIPVLVPETFVFRGGGWGHAVGLCQSGAMGRAEAGIDYASIVKAYFAGVEIGTLKY
ncbi:MAG: SpoIID/LytB domain-containing protein [Elusimicrobiota bacterium]